MNDTIVVHGITIPRRMPLIERYEVIGNGLRYKEFTDSERRLIMIYKRVYRCNTAYAIHFINNLHQRYNMQVELYELTGNVFAMAGLL